MDGRLGWMALATWIVGCGRPDVAEVEAPVAEAGTVVDPACFVGDDTCEGRQRCADLPGDVCDPEKGHESCPGICQSCEDPTLGRTYVEQSRRSCSRIRLRCNDGQRVFNDPCGCGCERIPTPDD